MFPGTEALSWLWAIAALSFSVGFILWVASSFAQDFPSQHNPSEPTWEMEDADDAEPAWAVRFRGVGIDLMVVGLIALVSTLVAAVFVESPRVIDFAQ
jgi:hypothetical protein